ncbi:cysteine-rich RLK (RECEPTOR-like protein kinase) 25 [Hibiscus trionum]|uniref:non-specific serine/threonine protein kinase n=1 Tax=Hibiscus trionum TaxID=183268 RepID=A0A9W7HAH3_HIBTR|nr:cysteine-rich RLK (RECEPTOR-like protein kinase) 25 [Hibiscus trionum]
MARLLYYKPGALPLCFITILVLIDFTTCQLFNYYCLGPENDTATAGYRSNLATLLDSMASRASDHNFYNDSFNGIYSLFLCRSDVSHDACRLCMNNVTRLVTQSCPGDKRAIMWFELCMIRYSDIDFFGQATLEPFFLRWNPENTTSPPEGDIGTRGFVYSLVEQAIFAANMSAEGGLDARDGPGRRYGRAQCSRDLNVNSCSTCLRNLLNRTEACCMDRTGWQVLNPSCYLRYDTNPVSDQPPAPPSENDGEGGNRTTRIIIIIVSSLAGVFVVAALVGFLYQRKRRFKDEGTRQEILLGRSHSSKPPHLMEIGIHLSDEDHDDEMHQFNLATIHAATSNFSEENKLGEGGFGPVYKGKMLNGKVIAVKRLSMRSRQGLGEFKNEVKLIVKLQHKNLVRLFGYCLEKDEMLLVYEFMANTSLDTFLFDPEKSKAVLDWEKRSNIIIGTARGLQYLHEDSRLKIIHRDLKASNVLLDDDMNPKISDFGTARIVGGNQIEANTEHVVGTYGYMAPEYALEGLFSNKSDVYSFGILMLEILSGKKNRGFLHCLDGGQILVTYAWMIWIEGRGHELIDPNIADDCPVSEAVRWIHIALLCVQDDPAVRPTMSSVILMLGSKSINLPQPSTPPYSTARFISMSDQSSSIGTGSGLLASDQSITSASSLLEQSKKSEIQFEP